MVLVSAPRFEATESITVVHALVCLRLRGMAEEQGRNATKGLFVRQKFQLYKIFNGSCFVANFAMFAGPTDSVQAVEAG